MKGWRATVWRELEERPTPSAWMERNFVLSRSYAGPGELKLFPWQRFPADCLARYDVVVFIAPTQTGKSMLCEGLVGWTIDCAPTNMMIAYHKQQTVQDNFDERLKPLITDTPVLARYWDGDPDNLTKRRIKLNHLVARVASAGARGDLASHNAGFIYGDEVAKWSTAKGYNPLKLLTGRTHASRMLGRRVKQLYCTSPRTDQDYSYQLATAADILFVRPHYPCPRCGAWFFQTDSEIKERPGSDGKCDHSPTRIRAEQAAYYECPTCKGEILELDRIAMADHVVYAAVDPKTGNRIEDIDKNGNVVGRRETSGIAINWTRLVDVTWSFAECLASYFEALHSPDGNTLADYANEDMARWVFPRASRYSEGWLQKRARQSKYCQYGTGAYLPEGALILLAGIDTQDDGFYWVVRAFGAGLESWLVRSDYTRCPMDQVVRGVEGGRDVNYGDPGQVFTALTQDINRWPYQKADGTKLPISFGLIDRGGHRSDDVDYIVGHAGYLGAYIGSTQRDAGLVRRNDKGIYLGNTEALSRTVEKQMESEIWHLPKDISTDYCRQVLEQHEQEYTDTRGNTRRRWVTGDDTGHPDHYRDAENLVVGASVVMDIQGQLHSPEGQERVREAVEKAEAGQDNEPAQTFTVDGASMNDYLRKGGWGR